MERQSIIITGGFGGMGYATAKHLAARGYRVFALDKTTGEGSDGIIPIETDITDEESIRRAFAAVACEVDSIFAIIHFAGVYMLDSLVEMESAAFDRIMRINLQGAYLVNKIFFPLLCVGSRILITTSELAPLDPLPFTGVYAVSKSALDKYAYSLRMELQLKGISVSVLRAGAVDTGMLGVSTAALDRFCQRTEIYTCNAEKFKRIVDRVEARCVKPAAIAEKAGKILRKRKPRFAYSINRNPLLRLLNILPASVQFWIIKRILKE